MHQIPHVFCSFATESKFCGRQVTIEEQKFTEVYLDVDIQKGLLIFDILYICGSLFVGSETFHSNMPGLNSHKCLLHLHFKMQ